jgi:ribosomal protein S18 acetylase RimI-like enzyme
MKQIVLGGKQFTIKRISEYTPSDARRFLRYINTIIAERDYIQFNKKLSLKDEIAYLRAGRAGEKKRKRVELVAQFNNDIAGITEMTKGAGVNSHVAGFGISVAKQYRGIGLGEYLIREVLRAAKKELKPKYFRLTVMSTNTRAMNLYKKVGFKIVARIPEQIQRKGTLIDEIVMLKKL